MSGSNFRSSWSSSFLVLSVITCRMPCCLNNWEFGRREEARFLDQDFIEFIISQLLMSSVTSDTRTAEFESRTNRDSMYSLVGSASVSQPSVSLRTLAGKSGIDLPAWYHRLAPSTIQAKQARTASESGSETLARNASSLGNFLSNLIRANLR